MKPKVLVVEDERKIAASIGAALESAGCAVVLAEDGERGFFRLSTEPFDAVVLDRMLPGSDGLEVLRALRGAGHRMPVLVLTALGEVDERVEGLEAGADDYLAKPFAMSELVARVRSLLRRGSGAAAETTLSAGDLRLDLLQRQAEAAGCALALTRTEWDLLALLVRAGGGCVSRDAIVHELWPRHARDASTDNLIEAHVGRLRRKLAASGSATGVATVRGVGYRIDEGGA